MSYFVKSGSNFLWSNLWKCTKKCTCRNKCRQKRLEIFIFNWKLENDSLHTCHAGCQYFYFLAGNQLYELLNWQERVMRRRMSQKTIDIFGYKTVTFEHRHDTWECDSARECDSEHRHENKSCSQHVKRVNERWKEWELQSVRVMELLLSIDMKTKVVQHVESAFLKFFNIPGPQLLSDIQTFVYNTIFRSPCLQSTCWIGARNGNHKFGIAVSNMLNYRMVQKRVVMIIVSTYYC